MRRLEMSLAPLKRRRDDALKDPFCLGAVAAYEPESVAAARLQLGIAP